MRRTPRLQHSLVLLFSGTGEAGREPSCGFQLGRRGREGLVNLVPRDREAENSATEATERATSNLGESSSASTLHYEGTQDSAEKKFGGGTVFLYLPALFRAIILRMETLDPTRSVWSMRGGKKLTWFHASITREALMSLHSVPNLVSLFRSDFVIGGS